VFCKKIFENLRLFSPFLGLLANIDVFCRKIFENFDPFQNFYLVPGNLSNLIFLAGAEQLICRTPPLVAYFFE